MSFYSICCYTMHGLWLAGTVLLPAEGLHAAQQSYLPWQSLPAAFEEARHESKPILVYVHAPSCGPCLKMEEEVFPEVAPLLDHFARGRLNFDDNESTLNVLGNTRSPLAWAMHFGAAATPSFVLLTPAGDLVTTVSGFVEPRGFELLLAYVSTNAYKHASFEHYVASIQP